MNPPLRTKKDVAALITGLREGVIDCIATDHAPHTRVDKLCEFALAGNGIVELETSFASLMSLVHSKQLDLVTLISKMSSEPARIVNKNHDWLGTLRPGYRADVTLFDPDLEWVVDTSKFLSKSTNT